MYVPVYLQGLRPMYVSVSAVNLYKVGERGVGESTHPTIIILYTIAPYTYLIQILYHLIISEIYHNDVILFK